MSRKFSTPIAGQHVAQATIGAVWRIGKVIDGYKSSEWRYAIYDKPMIFAE